MKFLKNSLSYFFFIFSLSGLTAKPFVTSEEYAQFLNSSATNDEHHLYEGIGCRLEAGGDLILRYGEPGNYYYEAAAGKENIPMEFVSCFDAARYFVFMSSEERETSFISSADLANSRCGERIPSFLEHENGIADLLLKSNQIHFSLLDNKSMYQASTVGIVGLGLAEKLKEVLGIVAIVGGAGAVERTNDHQENRAVGRGGLTNDRLKLDTPLVKASVDLTSKVFGCFLDNSLENAEKSLVHFQRQAVVSDRKRLWMEVISTAECFIGYIRKCHGEKGWNINARTLAAIDRAEEALRMRVEMATKGADVVSFSTFLKAADYMEEAAHSMFASFLEKNVQRMKQAYYLTQSSLQLQIARSANQTLAEFFVMVADHIEGSIEARAAGNLELASVLMCASRSYEEASKSIVQIQQALVTGNTAKAAWLKKKASSVEQIARRLAEAESELVGANEAIASYRAQASKYAAQADEAHASENHELASALTDVFQMYEMAAENMNQFKQALVTGNIAKADWLKKKASSIDKNARRLAGAKSELMKAYVTIASYRIKASNCRIQAERAHISERHELSNALMHASQHYEMAAEKMNQFKQALIAGNTVEADRLKQSASSIEKNARRLAGAESELMKTLDQSATAAAPVVQAVRVKTSNAQNQAGGFLPSRPTVQSLSATKSKIREIQPSRLPRHESDEISGLTHSQTQLTNYVTQANDPGAPGYKIWKQVADQIEDAQKYIKKATSVRVQDPKKAECLIDAANEAMTAAEHFAQAARSIVD